MRKSARSSCGICLSRVTSARSNGEEALADDGYARIQMVDNVSKENSTPYSYFTDELTQEVKTH